LAEALGVLHLKEDALAMAKLRACGRYSERNGQMTAVSPFLTFEPPALSIGAR